MKKHLHSLLPAIMKNPRHARALQALIAGPCSREELDRVVGASNSPALVMELRHRGLTIYCTLVSGYDRDFRRIKYGMYHLDAESRYAVEAWLRQRHLGGAA